MKEKIIIMLDWNAGPIWGNYMNPITFDRKTGIDIIDKDPMIKELNNKISDIYSSYYNFSDNESFSFDYKKEKEDKSIILDLLKKLIHRLNELNDGSFEIEDRETKRIEAL